MMRIFFIALLCGLVTSCVQEPKSDRKTKKAKPEEKNLSKHLESHEFWHMIDKAEGTRNARRKELWKKQKNSLDSVIFALNLWNDGINASDPVKIHDCYTSGKISYYLKEKDARNIAISKMEWLEKHEGYSQKIGRIQVQYPYEYDQELIRCFFEKICIEKKKSDTVKAILEFRKINNDYVVVRETDLITEKTRAKNAKGLEFPQGESTYLRDYWEDTRNDKVLAHSFVPYWVSVDVNRSGNKISVDYSHYSGSLRSIEYYAVKDERLKNGVLEFRAAMKKYMEEEPDEIDDDRYDYHRFKLTGDGLVLMESGGVYEGYEGIDLVPQNADKTR